MFLEIEKQFTENFIQKHYIKYKDKQIVGTNEIKNQSNSKVSFWKKPIFLNKYLHFSGKEHWNGGIQSHTDGKIKLK